MKFEIPKFHFRFKDRQWAGRILAPAIKDILKKNGIKDDSEITILGIPRGGVIIAKEVANKISNSCNFDIVIPKKLTAPDNKELAIGAIMEDGTTYLNKQLFDALQISDSYLEKESLNQLAEIKRRNNVYCVIDSESQRLGLGTKIRNKIVILVDDGAATGSTLIAAARWIRKLQPKNLIIAVPVAPKQTIDILKNEADYAEVFSQPDSSKFGSVGQYYQSFNPVMDEEVRKVLQRRIK